MDHVAYLLGKSTQAEPYDRRPRWLRRILPMSYATAVPLTGEQMARIHIAAYH